MDGSWFLCFERAGTGRTYCLAGAHCAPLLARPRSQLCATFFGGIVQLEFCYLCRLLLFCCSCGALLRCAAAVRQTGVREHDRCCDTVVVCVALKCVSFLRFSWLALGSNHPCLSRPSGSFTKDLMRSTRRRGKTRNWTTRSHKSLRPRAQALEVVPH